MACNYLLVIGTDRADSPLAATFEAIGKGLEKDIRVYLVTEQGSSEYDDDGKKQSFRPSVESAGHELLTNQGKKLRLLLFDASSPAKGGFKPYTGLFAWASWYRSLWPQASIVEKRLTEVLDFFEDEEPSMWWAGLVGLVKTEGGDAIGLLNLLGARWEEEMKGLDHDEKNEEAQKKGRSDEQ